MRSIERFFSDLIVFLAFSAVIVAMLMTVGDILLRLASSGVEQLSGVRPTWGLQGLVDLTQLAIMVAVPLAIAAAFHHNKHIRIELISELLSGGLRRAAQALSALVGVCLMSVCLWTALKELQSQLEFTTTSATLNIPYTWYWIPLATGFALSLLACIVSLFRCLRKSTSTRDNTHV